MPLSSVPAAHILQVETGLQQLMGDRVLYLQILRRFRQSYQDSAALARQALLAGDSAGAQRIVHTLKGAAAMVGAQQVYLLASALEPVCAGPAPACLGPLGQLEPALRNAMAMVDQVLDAAETEARQAAAPGAALSLVGAADTDPAAAHLLAQHLAQLLEEGDGAAIDVIEQSGAALAGCLGAPVFQEMAAAAQRYDFEAALAVLAAAGAVTPA